MMKNIYQDANVMECAHTSLLQKMYAYFYNKKKEKLLALAIEKKIPVNRASKKLRVNNSNAKVIVRTEKEKRLMAKTENNSTLKVEYVKI